jgi:hypothetical protein
MRCKPGDMAIITQRIPHNVGKLVLVVEYFGEKDYPHLDLWNLPCWTVESMGGTLTCDTGQIAHGGFIPDLALQPIGETTLTRRDLEQARAEAELEAAWENLREIAREMERQATLREEQTVEADKTVPRNEPGGYRE